MISFVIRYSASSRKSNVLWRRMVMAFYALLVGALLCSSKGATENVSKISLSLTDHVSKMSSIVTDYASKTDELLTDTTDSIASRVDESTVHSTFARGNSPTITTDGVTARTATIMTTNTNKDPSAEGVTLTSEYPVTTSNATIIRNSTNTGTSEGMPFSSDFPETSSRATITTTNINADTSAEGVTFSSQYPVTTNINTGTSGNTRMTECRLPGVLYQGSRNITESGRSCQRWQTQTPHAHNYDVFSLAQENYCRNFDREEPWCFTNDSNVRWELCGVDVCDSPCLNQSYYNKEITTLCLSDTINNAEYCKYTLDLVKCLKNSVENSSGVQCPQIPLKSVAQRLRNMMEMLTGSSISECIIFPCTIPSVDVLYRIVNESPCKIKSPRQDSSSDAFCRDVQRISHCAISEINKESKSTCVVKDKIYLAKKFKFLIPPELSTNYSVCISNSLSEFPPPVENTTFFAVSTASSDQIVLTLSVVSVLVLIFIISIGIGLYKRRANTLRKTARRLPSIPKKGDHPYEFRLHYPEELNYTDPDYQTVEEMNDGYEHLMGIKSKLEGEGRKDGDDQESYVQPNDVLADASITNEDEHDKHHSYLEVLECPEKLSCTTHEGTEMCRLASKKCVDETATKLELKSVPEVQLDMNEQETVTILHISSN